MSFLYPSLISITRTAPNGGTGAIGYGGLPAQATTVVATNIPAHIQADRQGTRPQAGLPSDAAGQSIWKIVFPGAKGLVLELDVIADEQGKRYHVVSADWGPLVTTCRCQLLEV